MIALSTRLLYRNLRRQTTMTSVKTYCTAPEEVLFDRVNNKRIITLNRPEALNALTLNMIRKMYSKLKDYEKSDHVDLIILKSNHEKSFCAGGDVRSIVEAANANKAGGQVSLTQDFFREEYRLNYLIGTYTIPFVSLIDGITMGGGFGISVHSPFRVATDRTVFAMPETAIGLFADVGGSYFLSRLPGHLGMFLALTGHRLTGRDVAAAGVATHYVDHSKIGDLEQALCIAERTTPDTVLMNLQAFASTEPHEFSLAPYLEKIDRCFNAETVEGILENLERDGSEWAVKQLSILSKFSPTSMKVTHRELLEGANKTFKECFIMEYRLAQRSVADHDFMEGVRALLIDKDRSPRWKPPTLKDVGQKHVDWYFSRLPDEDELTITD